MQAYPSLKPYLKGFHLSLKTWQGGRDADGWKVRAKQAEKDSEEENATAWGEDDESDDNSVQLQDNSMEELKMNLLVQASTGASPSKSLEECMKAMHKRTDAFHIFLIPRLFSPTWLRIFYKLSRPWSLRGTPLLVELAGRLREVLKSGEGDGRDILCQLLRIPGRAGTMSDGVAHQLLQMPREGTVSNEDTSRCSGESMVQAETEGG